MKKEGRRGGEKRKRRGEPAKFRQRRAIVPTLELYIGLAKTTNSFNPCSCSGGRIEEGEEEEAGEGAGVDSGLFDSSPFLSPSVFSFSVSFSSFFSCSFFSCSLFSFSFLSCSCFSFSSEVGASSVSLLASTRALKRSFS